MAKIENYEEINALLTKEMGAPIITKWVILVELIGDDGERRAGFLTSDGCSEWDELGLIEHHRQYRQAGSPNEDQ